MLMKLGWKLTIGPSAEGPQWVESGQFENVRPHALERQSPSWVNSLSMSRRLMSASQSLAIGELCVLDHGPGEHQEHFWCSSIFLMVRAVLRCSIVNWTKGLGG